MNMASAEREREEKSNHLILEGVNFYQHLLRIYSYYYQSSSFVDLTNENSNDQSSGELIEVK